MKTYVDFEENGGEYYGRLIITSKGKVEKLSDRAFGVDGVCIVIDEKITDIYEYKHGEDISI